MEKNTYVTRKYIKGICKTMCPPSEIKVRERQNRVHKFERIEGTEHLQRPRADKSRIIKEYSRPAAGKPEPRPEDIRPTDLLLKTTDFLLKHVCSKTDVTWSVVYEYVFDRLRAVRQDMVMQNVYNNDTIHVLERTIRFHIYASYVLCEAPLADFDPKINDTHIQECIKRLISMYDHASCKCRQYDFLTLYLLFNVGNVDALVYCLNFKSDQKTTDHFEMALAISLAWWNKNFVRVLRLCKSLNAIELYAAHRHISSARRELLRVMSHGYNSKNLTFPISDLAKLLAVGDEEHCIALCTSHGLLVTEKGVQFSKSNFTAAVQSHLQREQWLDDKLDACGIPLYELLIGETCYC